MCGILVYLQPPKNHDFLRTELCNRGPDYHGSYTTNGITFESSVLSLREPLTKQPFVSPNSVVCFNGEIYHSDPESTVCSSDTEVFSHQVSSSLASVYELEGEFAFVYYSQAENTIYFGRDYLGRRSLNYSLDAESRQLVISSVSGPSFTECDALGKVYAYDLGTHTLNEMMIPIPAWPINEEWGQLSNDMGSKVEIALRNAVKRRCLRPKTEKVSLLFSGGLDCTILAALLDQCLEPEQQIELLNVAFENRRTNSMFETPDRILAHKSWANLKIASTNPQRFMLREINVPYEEAVAARDQVQMLMAPVATVMDLSIAIAFYFAAKPHNDEHSRILFSGLGADELFAGYSRHTTAAQSGDPVSLASELTMDFRRLPHRNLGRDDRVVATWGREVRYPFLDNEVVKIAMGLPLAAKTDGATTKRVLRKVAESLGLTSVIDEKKRAIQFGARSAKMDPGSGNSKGHQLFDK